MYAFPGGTTAEYAFTEHEHRELAPGLNRIHDVAAAGGSLASPDLSIALLDTLDWLETILEPHASWEDRWLYPRIDALAGSSWATKLMRFEHQQIRAIARQLEADWELLHRTPSADRTVELRGRLFALEALLRAHIEREERFLIPLLEGVDDKADRPAATIGAATG